MEQRPKCKGLTVEYLIDSTEKRMLGNYTFQTSNGYNVEIKQRPHRIIDVSATEEVDIDVLYFILTKLEKLLQEEMAQNATLTAENEKLNAEVARLEPFEQQQIDFYAEKEKFYEEVVYSDKSPDPEKFAQYYELIDPDNAAAIYQKIKQQGADDAAIKAFATTYSGMKAKSAAKIFDEMVAENQIELVAKILAQMSVETRGDILAAMMEENAAKLTQLLEPTSLQDKSTKVTG